MAIKSTRLRYISAPEAELLAEAVDALPFKVEIKSISFQQKRWVCFFILPEIEGMDIKSVDLEL